MPRELLCSAVTKSGTLCANPVNRTTRICSAGHTPRNRGVDAAALAARDAVGDASLSGTLEIDDLYGEVEADPPKFAPWPRDFEKKHYFQDEKNMAARHETSQLYAAMSLDDLRDEAERLKDWYQDWDSRAAREVGPKRAHIGRGFWPEELEAEGQEILERQKWVKDAIKSRDLAEKDRLRARPENERRRAQWLEACIRYDELSDEEITDRIHRLQREHLAMEHIDRPTASDRRAMSDLSVEIGRLQKYRDLREDESTLDAGELQSRIKKIDGEIAVTVQAGVATPGDQEFVHASRMERDRYERLLGGRQR